MNKLFASIIIASLIASCKDNYSGPLGVNSNFIGDQMIWLSDTSWVYDSVNHVYTAKLYPSILTDYAVSHYQVKVSYGTTITLIICPLTPTTFFILRHIKNWRLT